ncbi:acyltransferase [Sporomusa sp.]|uniref:acyltransferase n=1 Tax=Sporomusa sp. TaxID=2078658 RepID=UPI002C4DF8EB|nr:acyltransferase [Sporomusa sp.]HWR41611.1 acyltransferase [Sporomusa sp.]
MPFFKHEQAIVDSNNIGDGTKIWEFVHVLPHATIGENCNICAHVFIENDVIIGDNVTVKCGVYVWDGVRVKDNAFLGPNVTFTNDVRPRSKQYPLEVEKTIIEEGASIGANSTIIAGNTVGKYAMVGAGSVVTKNIPNNTLWYGNPATFKAYICKCGEKLDSVLSCNRCNKSYILNNDNFIQEKSDLTISQKCSRPL